MRAFVVLSVLCVATVAYFNFGRWTSPPAKTTPPLPPLPPEVVRQHVGADSQTPASYLPAAAPAPSAPAPKPKVYKLSIEDLARQMNENEAACEARNAGYRYEIKGAITDIRKNPWGGVIVELSSQDQRRNRRVVCYIDKSTSTADLKVGYATTVFGDFKEISFGQAVLKNCSPD